MEKVLNTGVILNDHKFKFTYSNSFWIMKTPTGIVYRWYTLKPLQIEMKRLIALHKEFKDVNILSNNY